MAKLPSPSSPSRWETGEASPCAGGGRFGRPGPRRRPGVGEKGLEGAWGSIPQLTSARGAARERGDVNRRRRAEMAAAAAL